MALNMIGLNQSLQTTQIKFYPNLGINLCDLVKIKATEKRERERERERENAAYHN